ncbi:hypothetical protein ACLOJK_014800 [Asimina triloba]
MDDLQLECLCVAVGRPRLLHANVLDAAIVFDVETESFLPLDNACVAQMEKACTSLPSGISVCYNLTWPTILLMKDGLLGDLRFGLAAGQLEKKWTMGLDLGRCSCLPSPFDLGLPID